MLQNDHLLNQFRWVTIGIEVTILALSIALHLPINSALFVLGIGIQVLVNTIAIGIDGHHNKQRGSTIFIQLLIDLLCLNLFFIACGGLANPFSGLFIVIVIFAAIYLNRAHMAIIIASTAFSYSYLILGNQDGDSMHHEWMAFHLRGMVINHIITTLVVAYFIAQIMTSLRNSQRRINAAQSLAGAGVYTAQIAHKLATPLTTLLLLSEDIPKGPKKTAITKELAVCNRYITQLVSRLTQLDGEPYTESLTTYLTTFFQHAATQYPTLRSSWSVSNDPMYQHQTLELIAVVFDIFFENAVEARATEVRIDIMNRSKWLEISIVNNGRPLSDSLATMMVAGFSNCTSSGHTGLGLFFVRLILDNLGANCRLSPGDDPGFIINIPKSVLQL